MFGASAGTVVRTFLTTPSRPRAVSTQLTVASIAGAVLGLVGASISASSVAIGPIATDYSFMVPAADVAQFLAASILAGAAGAVLGAGIGTLVRNPSGAVTGTILLLVIIPPLAVRMVNETAS